MGQWLLAAVGLVGLLVNGIGLLAALGYLSALVVRVLPLVGRRKAIRGARTVRDRVVFRGPDG